MRITQVRIDYGSAYPQETRIIRGDAPVFSWAYEAAQGEEQQAFRVCAGCATGEPWESGWILSEKQEIRYAGEPLVPGRVYTVEVRVRDGVGRESLPEMRRFCPGRLKHWEAPWICLPDLREDGVATFARDFTAKDGILSATLFCCGLGYHKVLINGREVSSGPMSPPYSEYDKRAYYSVITGLEESLHAGENRIGIAVASGWRSPANVFYKLTKWVPPYTGPLQLTAALRVEYAGGETEWHYSDGNWQGFEGPVTYSNIFIGERFDASRVTPGWCLPGAALPGARQAVLCTAPVGKMEPDTLEPVAYAETYPAVSVYPIGTDAYVADFGQNIAGVCRLRIPRGIQTGTTIEISHAEIVDEDGTLFTAPLRGAEATDHYTAAGDGRDPDTWQPEFTYHGFRYAMVRGYPVALTQGDIQAVSLHTALPQNGSFRCGNALVNAIHKCVVQTEKANIHSVLTDCPQRDERVQWLNDATVRFEETPYNFDIGRIFPKVVRDCMDIQDEQGAITCTAPFAGGTRPADPVCSSYIIAGWQAYMHTGNLDVLREGYSGFRRWNEFLQSRSEDWIVQYSYYGDWAGPAYACQSEEYAVSAVTPGILMSTGYFFYNERLLGDIAQAIGMGDEAARHRERVGMIRDAFLQKWWNAETGKVGTGSQGCQAFALWLDILPPEGRQKAADALHVDLVEKEYKITTGNLCTRYMMDALSRYGYVEDAWRLVTREEYPSWGYMIQQEATTVWERFELKKNPTMNSHSHPMYGAVGYWFYAYLAGVKPVEAGWRRFSVAPVAPVGLQSASATVGTPYGDVYVRWVKRYGAFHLHLCVPHGTMAEVRMPGGETAQAGPGFHHFSEPLL